MPLDGALCYSKRLSRLPLTQTHKTYRNFTTSAFAGSSLARAIRPDRKSTRLNSSHTEIYTLSLHDALPIYSKRLSRLPLTQTHKTYRNFTTSAFAGSSLARAIR